MQCLFLVKEQYATYNTATEANKKVLNVTTICCQRSVHYEQLQHPVIINLTYYSY